MLQDEVSVRLDIHKFPSCAHTLLTDSEMVTKMMKVERKLHISTLHTQILTILPASAPLLSVQVADGSLPQHGVAKLGQLWRQLLFSSPAGSDIHFVPRLHQLQTPFARQLWPSKSYKSKRHSVRSFHFVV